MSVLFLDYYAEGEPYDRKGLALSRSGVPLSVWSAIGALYEDRGRWERMAKDCFGLSQVDAPLLMAEAVMDRVRETGRVASFVTYDEVFIDPSGKHRLVVSKEAP